MSDISPKSPAVPVPARRFKHAGVLVFGIVVIVAAVAVQMVKLRDIKEGDRSSAIKPIALASQLSNELAGWKVKEEALGPNEFIQSAVERTLNYDDYVYRTYRRGNQEFSVYIAYWSAGRMPVNKVASHTPDRCWTENGWRCEDMRFNEVLGSGDFILPPGQWRRFKPPAGPNQYVLYWHIVGDQLYDYGERFNESPHLLKWWRDSLNYALNGSQAQYFIRITSLEPVETFQNDPGFREVMRQLVKIGLKPEMRPGLAI